MLVLIAIHENRMIKYAYITNLQGGNKMSDDLRKNMREEVATAVKRCRNRNPDNYNLIYPFTTENIAGYIDCFDLEDKTLLTVGSSGDQVINAALKGAREITLLDINPCAKYYYYLKEAGILEFSLAEFNKFFRYIRCYDYPKYLNNNKKVFNKLYYRKIKDTLQALDNDSYLFWDELLSEYAPEEARILLFNLDEPANYKIKRSNLYLQSERLYNETKNKLPKAEKKFITGDVFEIETSQTFDNIWLSDIAKQLRFKEIGKLTNKFIENLNDEGRLLINYLYTRDYDVGYLNDNPTLFNEGDINMFLHKYKTAGKVVIPGIAGFRENDKSIKDQVWVYQKKKEIGDNNEFVKR